MKQQRVIRGRYSLKKLPTQMEKFGMKRPMIVGSVKLADKLRAAANLEEAPLFSGYHPNPDLEDALAGAELFREKGCDGILAIGGGSALDTAKAVKAFLSAPAEEVRNNHLPESFDLPMIAIPGTAGSGAEATCNAVVYADGKKLSLGSPMLLPDGVVLDSSLLETLPLYHKKSCALDALAQGIESYWSAAATEDSRVHAYLAILGVLDNLKAYLAGDPHAADEMLDASFQSGKASRMTRTTAAHAMSYQITKMLGPAHGHACMLTLPVLWDWMIDRGDEDNQAVMNSLASIMRLGDPRMGSRLLRGILYDLEMEIPPLPEDQTLDALADSVNPERLGNHPMKLTRDDLRRIYVQAFLPPEENVRQACLDIWKYYGGQDRG